MMKVADCVLSDWRHADRRARYFRQQWILNKLLPKHSFYLNAVLFIHDKFADLTIEGRGSCKAELPAPSC